MSKVLIGSPIRQKENILKEFFEALTIHDYEGLEIEYIFIDDNLERSHELAQFAEKNKKTLILKGDNIAEYHCNEEKHYWQENLIWKVAAYKNKIIEYAIAQKVDYLFLVDSDIYLNPNIIKHLIKQQKDIISEVFWTKWDMQYEAMPQVWVEDQYRLFRAERGAIYSLEEQRAKNRDFMNMLKKPGVYKVGGLGACTLMSRYALEKGVNFAEIYNLTLVGEDRHFCIRAVALGLELYADTYYPPFHIYRESEVCNLAQYKQSLNRNINTKKLTVGLLVKNEADRYLVQVLRSIKKYADEVVVLDDQSSDKTVAVCCEELKGIPHSIVENKISGFNNEVDLRKKLWDLACTTRPDWIMILDADEVFEDRAIKGIRELVNDSAIGVVYFRLYDMWDMDHYREDGYWIAHKVYRPLMIRYYPDFEYKWQETPLHCGRLPINIFHLPGGNSHLRLKHYGWAKPEDRVDKFFRYKKLDPQAVYGIREQYLSILDPEPNLIRWNDEEEVR